MASIKIRTKRLNGHTQIRVLITHPMEQGRNVDKLTGQIMPAHYLKNLTIKHNDKVIVHSEITENIAKDPYFAFMLKEGKVDDSLTVSWTDNLGKTDSVETKIT